MARRTGKPSDELFMQRPGDGCDSPTVAIEPLRIVKPTSPPRNRAASSSSSRFASPPPANKHKFPLPPGASSSASPLPYPDDDDDDDLFQKKPNPPYPDDRRKAPQRIELSDQENRTSGGSGRPTAYDTAPRFTSPTERTGPGLSERRGNAPQPLPASPEIGSSDRDEMFGRLPPKEQIPQAGASAVYQGLNEITPSTSPPAVTRPQRQGSAPPVNSLEQDFQRMQMSAEEPPPAYSSVTPGANSRAYPAEKQQRSNPPAAIDTTPKPNIAPPLATPANNPDHPAFANEPRQEPIQQQPTQPGPSAQPANVSPFQGVGPTSPPPLPEGWIAHLDQNSGQYYYIHLPTQATQWEFPKGPTPLNDVPLSPVLSTYGGYGNPMASPGLSMFSKQSLASPGFQGMASPGFPPHTPGYAESIMSMASGTPTTAGFSGPPPSAGVDMYKVVPTNGVYFGPYLRYVNMDMENGIWLGTIMLVTDAPQPPTIHIHQSVDLSPNPRQLRPNPIYTHRRWVFYRYDIDLKMGEGLGDKWTYAITSHLGCTRYEFLVAGRFETNWRFIAHSGNDFAMNTTVNERSKLGGIGFMWKDILQKNVECGGFHVQLGLGDQIYGDRLWKDIPLLKQWLAMSGKENRRTAAWTARHEEEVSHAYFHYYTSHFDQPYLREAFAQIPHILQIDDHDIFDGYGSYPEYMQNSNMFRNIGRVGIEMYLLFQHHTTVDILRNVSTDIDLFTITGTGWHFVKYLGPSVVVVGPDCRSERTQRQVLAGPTYQGILPKVATLPPSVQHCIWMISVPLIYPRLEAVESLAHTMATGKKAVNSTYNLLGKVTSSVAGVVGGKEAVATGFSHVKKAVGKSGLMGGVLNTFGDIDIADELRDMWTHESKDLERTYLIRTLQGIAHQKGIRMTFLSGDVNCCGAGLVHDPSHPSNHKTMYQIIASAVVAAPPPSYVLKMLHNNKPLYVPQNGVKTTNLVSDTKEDMMEIFQTDTNGGPRDMKKLMGRRNYVAFVAFDPDAIMGGMSANGSMHSGNAGLAKLSLAVDFVVQGDGGFSPPTKYGPVIIPSLEFGR
ncbi:hypothetical protein SS1G_04517 [Sclerotinia sclerotiorum 1980 UF-70]|uniref:WW domain-containing protein n=1 Tax=Sclerotinia sclerotiorum (strain ATCC 18683 / 1980 / Ss-1) TaxID=665079 RepID=A7EGS5_SCLS1|nr:hypothetical protein SS1G_04517 [Sclerotinia sclerotiorum 1980 UF-70]EDO02041.1 hypothetical protein SS1G_04517 [Sclerotinia sclerotiorum 1980 UF-70]